MDALTLGEETMIGALAREVKDGDWAACGTLSPMPAAALWLAKLTHAPGPRFWWPGARIGPLRTSGRAGSNVPSQALLNVFT